MFWERKIKEGDFTQSYKLPEGWEALSEKQKKEFDDKLRQRSFQKEILKGRMIAERIKKRTASILETEAPNAFDMSVDWALRLQKEKSILQKENERNKLTTDNLVNEIKKLKSLIKYPSLKIEELETNLKNLYEKSQKSEIDALQIKNRFRDFLVTEFKLDSTFKQKDIDFLLQLIQEKKKFIPSIDTDYNVDTLIETRVPNLSFDNNESEFLNYVKSEKCFCGQEKHYGSLGCKSHKLETRRVSERLKIGMRQAWKQVFRKYTESTQNPFNKSTEYKKSEEFFDN